VTLSNCETLVRVKSFDNDGIKALTQTESV